MQPSHEKEIIADQDQGGQGPAERVAGQESVEVVVGGEDAVNPGNPYRADPEEGDGCGGE